MRAIIRKRLNCAYAFLKYLDSQHRNYEPYTFVFILIVAFLKQK